MNPAYWIGYSLSRIVGSVFFDYRAEGSENIPLTGPAVLAVNHQSYLDPPLSGIATKRDCCFLARKTLLDIPIMGPILPRLNVIPVSKDGADMSALKIVIRELKKDQLVLLFPEGTRSLDGKLQPAQAGIGLILAKSGAPVVPMRIFGSFQAWGKGSKGITPRPITVVAGRPIQFGPADFEGDARIAYQAAADRVLEAIRQLRPSPDRMRWHRDDPGLIEG